MSNSAFPWVRSSFCSDAACIEVASCDDGVLVRDSKNPDLPYPRFSTAEWQAFVEGIARSEFSF